jgi:hypothetical protein
MKPIEFTEANHRPKVMLKSALPMCRTKDGYITTCHKLTIKERFHLLFYGVIWLTQKHAPVLAEELKVPVERIYPYPNLNIYKPSFWYNERTTYFAPLS